MLASGDFSSDFFGEKPLYPTQGSLVRMMNCTLLGERGVSFAEAWMFVDGEVIPEIVNCDIAFLRIGLRSGGRARLRNSVLTECRLNVESPTAPPGTLEIERCVFWAPEPVADFVHSTFSSNSAIQIHAHGSIFVSPSELTFGHPHLFDWTGAGNTFVKPYTFRYSRPPLQLEQYQTEFQTEADSIELPPWEFDPAQWRILRDKSPGYQPRPDGTDYGADIDQLVDTLGRNAALPPAPAIAPFDAAQAKAHQAVWAQHLGVPVDYTNSIGMKFVLIPPGEFRMGSTTAEMEAATQAGGDSEFWQSFIQTESPQHSVILTQPFYLGITEVTQRVYTTVVGANPSHFSSTGPGQTIVANLDTQDYPVEMVSWNDAARFCVKLSQQETLSPTYDVVEGVPVTPKAGTGYRLPTEAEWEFACRAGSTTRYWSGERDEDIEAGAWCLSNSNDRTHAVGELQSNPWGLFDVSGNVWEWVQDGFDPDFYALFSERTAIDPAAVGPPRIIRGGNWQSRTFVFRPAFRGRLAPWHWGLDVGFRVSLSVEAVKEALTRR